MEINKPQYIRKYDFVRYFTRNEDEWFWPTNELKKYISQKTKQITNEDVNVDNDEEQSDDQEFDSYEYKKENEDLDQHDPRIYEGNLIDKESKKFIKSQFPECRKIYDFDTMYLPNDEAFKQTINLLKNNDNFILFQPSFIYKNQAIAKPDAFIKRNNEFILIETKGTATVKCSHLVDITYQHIVISECLKQIGLKINNYYLCLIDYKIAEKNELGFCLSEYASIVKNGYSSSTSNNAFIKYSKEWIAEKKWYKTANNKRISYFDILNHWDKLVPNAYIGLKGNVDKRWSKFINNYEKVAKIHEFDSIINKLINHKINYEPSLKPTIKYKNWFKDNDYWPDIRQYYANDKSNEEHQLFSYSGRLITFSNVYENYYRLNKTQQQMFSDFNNASTNVLRSYYERVINNTVVTDLTRQAFSLLKDKKVYFDFESLNLATRIIDDTLPFMQIVNQVSIIVDDGYGVNAHTKCNNILFDPQIIDKDNYKQIVDSLLPNNDLSICETYSYVVYNQSFEKARLEEMKWIINDDEYAKKIDIIINNLFDLANFFDPFKKEYICFKELKGFYSIKKVLPLVQQMDTKIYNAVGCKNYKTDLNIHNGSEAQSLSTLRFFKIINDDEWGQKADDLKKYCENDVRSMIVIEYYIRQLLN